MSFVDLHRSLTKKRPNFALKVDPPASSQILEMLATKLNETGHSQVAKGGSIQHANQRVCSQLPAVGMMVGAGQLPRKSTI